MRWGFAGPVALCLVVSACATTKAPTYTDASVSLSGCPSTAQQVRHHVRLPFTVINRSHGVWPASYLLLSLQGAAKGALLVFDAPNRGIGGGIRRVTAALGPEVRLRGALSVYLDKAASGSVTVGAWGAPANSVAVPTSYPSRSCRLHP